jgi:hypothetical protein
VKRAAFQLGALQSRRQGRERFFLDTRASNPIGEHFSLHGVDTEAWPKRQKRAFGLPMDDMGNSENRQVDTGHLERILEASLKEDDFYCRKSLRALMSMGLKTDDVRVLLAQYKSRVSMVMISPQRVFLTSWVWPKRRRMGLLLPDSSSHLSS